MITVFFCLKWPLFNDALSFLFIVVDTFSRPANGAESNQQGGWFQAFSVNSYKPYFDVDTTDVLERIFDSLFPFRGNFNEKTANNPDL